MTAPQPPVPPPPTRSPWRRRLRRHWMAVAAVVAVVAVLAGLYAWCSVEAGGYYAFQPGTAPTITPSHSCRGGSNGALDLPDGTPCARIVAPAGRLRPLRGRILMVDVLVGPASAAEWALRSVGLLGRVLPGTQLVPDASVLGVTPASQYGCQDTQEMGQATTTAPFVALRRLGYHVGSVDHGGRVFLVLPGTAASAAGIHCDDLVTAVDGTPTRTAAAVAAAIRSHRPGQQVRVTLERAGRQLTVQARLTGVPGIDGLHADPARPFLGVETEDDTTYTTPFPVELQVGDIGGPSAGLALTLATLDALSSGRLTGGHTVAATGTINPDGSVGDVSGVAQKTVAVQRAGATLFLVPPQELATARRAAGPGLRVEAVSSLSQALADLRAIGGVIPRPQG